MLNSRNVRNWGWLTVAMREDIAGVRARWSEEVAKKPESRPVSAGRDVHRLAG